MKKILFITPLLIFMLAVSTVIWFKQHTFTEVSSYETNGLPVIEIRGGIDRNGARNFSNELTKVESSSISSVIIFIDSPGGNMASALELSDRILNSRLKTYSLVKEGMFSALWFIAATDEIFFTKDGLIAGGGSVMEDSDPEMKERRENIRKYIENRLTEIADRKGHDKDLVLALSDPTKELVRDGSVLKQKGEIFAIKADKALQMGFSKGTMDSVEQLARMLERKGK